MTHNEMKPVKIRFGTDGWRGRIAHDFTFENVEAVMQAFADIFTQKPDPQFVYLGYDRRFLSQEFAKAAASVLLANGIEVRMAKQYCPTPTIAWMTKQYGAGAGVIITASHNPFDWNGIKFKEPGGGASSPDYTRPIEAQHEQNVAQGRLVKKISLQEGKQQGLLKIFDPSCEYIDQLKSMVDCQRIAESQLKILIDPMFGAGSGFFSKILGDQVSEIHSDGNPSFGQIQPEPIAKNLRFLMTQVRREGFDVGLATDGDADRIGAVDEKGNFVDSHHIFALLLKHLVENKRWKGDVIKTVSTTQMIDRLGERYSLKVHECAIGFKHICSLFRKLDPLIGGEESGGIAIARHVYERDGVLSGLMLLEIMSIHNKPLSLLIKELEDEIGVHRFHRQDLDLSTEKSNEMKLLLPDLVIDKLADIPVKKINRTDGCRIDLMNGSWVLVRASGTEPLLRIYAEASTDHQVEKLIAAIRETLSLGSQRMAE
jgi:alpha-D-glucose phosphate-specific phosphoglucomutase